MEARFHLCSLSTPYPSMEPFLATRGWAAVGDELDNERVAARGGRRWPWRSSKLGERRGGSGHGGPRGDGQRRPWRAWMPHALTGAAPCMWMGPREVTMSLCRAAEVERTGKISLEQCREARLRSGGGVRAARCRRTKVESFGGVRQH
jgi:hypothetical protein